MQRGQRLLTDAKIKSAVKKPGNYNDGDGLRLKVSHSRKSHWAVRYSINKRETETSIGSYPSMSLLNARKRKDEIKLLGKQGLSPAEIKAAEASNKKANLLRENSIFKACALKLIEKKRSQWTNKKHEAQWLSTLEQNVFPKLGHLSVSDIGIQEVVNTLEPIWVNIPETANRVRQRIESILDYAIAMELRSERFNPARWKNNLEHVLAQQKVRPQHHNSLAYRRLPSLIKVMNGKSSISATALQFCILTASRTTPIRLARWADIDFDQKIWTIPAEFLKDKSRNFRVPLTPQLTALLKKIRINDSPWVFCSPQDSSRAISGDTLRLHLLNHYPKEFIRTQPVNNCSSFITVHGFRSTFRVWAAEQTTRSNEVIELSLQHKVRNPVEAAYQRSDLLERRRDLLSEWNEFCFSECA